MGGGAVQYVFFFIVVSCHIGFFFNSNFIFIFCASVIQRAQDTIGNTRRFKICRSYFKICIQ